MKKFLVLLMIFAMLFGMTVFAGKPVGVERDVTDKVMVFANYAGNDKAIYVKVLIPKMGSELASLEFDDEAVTLKTGKEGWVPNEAQAGYFEMDGYYVVEYMVKKYAQLEDHFIDAKMMAGKSHISFTVDLDLYVDDLEIMPYAERELKTDWVNMMLIWLME